MTLRHRSPNYPGVDLEAAIEAVAMLYSRVRKGEFTATDASEAWGYTSTSGPVRVKLAALRQYGMLAGKKGENPTLSRNGLTFAIHTKASREYQEAMRLAAMSPSLFARVRDLKPNASDRAIRDWLLMDENFSEEGARRFVEVFRNTMRLAGFDESGIISGLEEDELLPESEDSPMGSAVMYTEHAPGSTPTQEPPKLSAAHTRVPLQLMGGSATVAVELPTTMTRKEWDQMMNMLSALKPGYVPEADDEHSGEPTASDS